MKSLIRKSWYTLTEAADYLTRSTEGGPVSVSDVLQLALDDDITISLRVNEESEAKFRFSLIARRSELTEEQLQKILKDSDEYPEDDPLAGGLMIDGELYLCTKLTSNWLFIDILDIVFFPWGEELFSKLWVESKNQPKTDPDSFASTIIKNPHRFGLEIQLVDIDRRRAYSVPTHAIPKNSYLVVKRTELERLLTDNTNDQASVEKQECSPYLEALPHDFRALYDALGAGELPDLDLLILAWRTFWKDRRPNDGKKYPINAEVADWIKNRMDIPEQSTSKAKAIASIIRPTWAPTGRQPNHN